jgi:hypothetical protein
MNGVQRVLTMVCDNQYHRGPGLCPSSGILNTRKHHVSETGCVSVHLISPEDGNRCSFRNVAFSSFFYFFRIWMMENLEPQ